MWPNRQETADLVTFTKKILKRKLHFFVKCELMGSGHISSQATLLLIQETFSAIGKNGQKEILQKWAARIWNFIHFYKPV